MELDIMDKLKYRGNRNNVLNQVTRLRMEYVKYKKRLLNNINDSKIRLVLLIVRNANVEL